MAARRRPGTPGRTRFAGGWVSPSGKEFEHEDAFYSSLELDGDGDEWASSWRMRQNNRKYRDVLPPTAWNLDQDNNTLDLESDFLQFVHPESYRHAPIIDQPHSFLAHHDSSVRDQGVRYRRSAHTINDTEISGDSGYQSNEGASSNVQTLSTIGYEEHPNKALVQSSQSWLAPVDESWPGLKVKRGSPDAERPAHPTGNTCATCFKVCHTQVALRHHERSHGRLHQCNQCQWSFAYRKDLLKHEATHSTTRPFACPELHCEYHWKGFKRKDHLARHIKSQHPPRSLERSSTIPLSSQKSEAETSEVASLEWPGSAAVVFGNVHTSLVDGTDYHAFAEGRSNKRRKVQPLPTQVESAESLVNPLSATAASSAALERRQLPSNAGIPSSSFFLPTSGRLQNELASQEHRRTIEHRTAPRLIDHQNSPPRSGDIRPDASDSPTVDSAQLPPLPLPDKEVGIEDENEAIELRITKLIDTIRDLTAWTEELAGRVNDISSSSSESASESGETENTSSQTQTTSEPTDDGDDRTHASGDGPAGSNCGANPGPSNTSRGREDKSKNTFENKEHNGQPQVDTHPTGGKTAGQMVRCVCVSCKGKDRDVAAMRRSLTYSFHNFWYCDNDDVGFKSEEALKKHREKKREDHLCKKSARWGKLSYEAKYATLAAALKNTYDEVEVFTQIQYVDPEPGDKPTHPHGQAEPKRRNRDNKRKRTDEEVEAWRKRTQEVEHEVRLLHRELQKQKAKLADSERLRLEADEAHNHELLREKAKLVESERQLLEANAVVACLKSIIQDRQDGCPSRTNGSTVSSQPRPPTPANHPTNQPGLIVTQHRSTEPSSGADNGDVFDPNALLISDDKLQEFLNSLPKDPEFWDSLQEHPTGHDMCETLSAMEQSVPAGATAAKDVQHSSRDSDTQKLTLADSDAAHEATADHEWSPFNDTLEPLMFTSPLQPSVAKHGTSGAPQHATGGEAIDYLGTPEVQFG